MVLFDGGKTDKCLKCKLLNINLLFIELLYKYKHIAYGQPQNPSSMSSANLHPLPDSSVTNLSFIKDTFN